MSHLPASLLAEWDHVRKQMVGRSFDAVTIEIVRLSFFLGAKAAVSAAIAGPPVRRDMALLQFASELRDFFKGLVNHGEEIVG